MGMSLIDYFDKGVAIEPDRPCLILGDQVRTYAEAQRSSYLIGNAMMDAGIKPGTCVAVLSHNAIKPFECVLGALRAGCTWVPVNARNALEETIYVLDHTDAEVVFYADVFAEQIPTILERCPKVSWAISIDGDGSDGRQTLDSLCSAASPERREIYIAEDALATLSCSGGTTGLPKGVMTTNRNWAFRIAEVMVRLAHPKPVHLVAAPMTHGAGAGALELMAMGATHVVMPHFDPAAILEAIDRHEVSHIFLPPTALYRVLSHPDLHKGHYSSLRYLICGGAPAAPDRVKEALSAFGPALHLGFGGTEIGGGVCWLSGREMIDALETGNEDLLLSCGRPAPVLRVEIVDDDGKPLPAGEAGEIAVCSYGNASGYYKNEEETARSFRKGWFYTGDVGYNDEQGFVYVSDRKKDMIISGGFNVYPSEIERVLMTHAAVQDCAVIGVPDAEWGEAVKAVVELKRDADVEPESLKKSMEETCRASLAGFKVPKSFEIWPEIPRSPVGKVLKRAVRERSWKDDVSKTRRSI
jgi:acyl-CoA synthetase (AMP-forming)/AMP-acid ligase II